MNNTDWVDTASLRHPLQAISTFSSDRHSSTKSICKEIKTNSVTLRCLDTLHQKEVLEKELKVKYNDYQSKIWGVPWLFTQLTRKYDVYVVFTKKGVKATINSVQRMTNSIHSGVITAIERTGLHALYVTKDYPCSFTTQKELEEVLENLDKNITMREECQRQAKIINDLFSPKTLVKKYYDMLMADL